MTTGTNHSEAPTTVDPLKIELELLVSGEHGDPHHIRHHQGVTGTSFVVWAPNARGVRVVGDFNSWDGRLHPMRRLGISGLWELFIPGVAAGARYKYELVTPSGALTL